MTLSMRKYVSWIPLSLAFFMILFFGYSLSAKQRELAEARERFKLAIDSSNSMLWVWDIEWDYSDSEEPSRDEKVWYSSSFAKFLGKSVDHYNGTLGDFFDALHDDDRASVLTSIRSTLRSGGEKPYVAEYRLRNQNGDWKWFTVRGSLLDSTKKNRKRIAGVVTPLEVLREDRLMLHGILDASPSPVVVCDSERKIVAWNRAAVNLTGYTSREVVGKKTIDFIIADPSVLASHINAFSDLSRLAADTESFEVRESKPVFGDIIKADGSRLTVRVQSKIVFYGNKFVIAASMTRATTAP